MNVTSVNDRHNQSVIAMKQTQYSWFDLNNGTRNSKKKILFTRICRWTNISSGVLTFAHHRKVIQLVAELMIQRFGNKISVDHKITVAKALVELFPSLATHAKNLTRYVSFLYLLHLIDH